MSDGSDLRDPNGPRDPNEGQHGYAHRDDPDYIPRSLEVQLEIAVSQLIDRVALKFRLKRRDAAATALAMLKAIT